MCCTAKARCLTTLSYPVAVAYAAYLSAVINATNLPDPRRMDSLF